MITDEEYIEIGFALEEGGLSHSEIDEYFEHHGVKGMKWGRRLNRSFTRTGRTLEGGANKTQSRKARNVKRTAAFLLGGGPVGLVVYNALSRPLKETSKNKKTQSGAAYATKLIATGILGTPASALAYHQIAKSISPKNKK